MKRLDGPAVLFGTAAALTLWIIKSGGEESMRTLVMLGAGLILAACESGGTSTTEMKTAAIEYARQELKLAADVPLQATVWIGTEQHEDQTVMCGTVSDTRAGATVPPKRFAATGDPINWLIFEDAHDAMVTTQPDRFPEWQRLCGRGPAST